MRKWGDQTEFFKEMLAKGHRVPTLENKPEIPSYLHVLLLIHRDLSYDGTIKYSDYCLWCDRNGVKGEQFAYLWEVLLYSLSKVYEWKQKELSSKKSAKTTENSSGRTEK